MFSKKKLNPLDAYNRWADSYLNESNPIKKFSDNLILNWLADINGKSVLDAGCGAGAICNLVRQKGASSIVGTDLSPVMVEEAKKNCREAEFKNLDLSKEKVNGKFDVVICALVLGHIKDIDFVLGNLIENISPKGMLLITDFHPFQTLNGAKRTFTDAKSRKTFEVEHYLHLFEEYFSIASNRNFFIEEFKERSWQNQPVVFGMKIRKKRIEFSDQKYCLGRWRHLQHMRCANWKR
ncbi:MAG: class I SAM-dependent methyltransferase [Cyclobacteriaceae bacterium]